MTAAPDEGRRVWREAEESAKAFLDQARLTMTQPPTSRSAKKWAGMLESEWRYLERGIRPRLQAAGLASTDFNALTKCGTSAFLWADALRNISRSSERAAGYWRPGGGGYTVS